MKKRVARVLRFAAEAFDTKFKKWEEGTTVPTDATAGYAPGCIFIKTDGGAGTTLYINEGTAASCDFNAK